MKLAVRCCDLCGKRIPEVVARELFVGVDGVLFQLAKENGDPVDTCRDCHTALRDEVLYRLDVARERRSIELERKIGRAG